MAERLTRIIEDGPISVLSVCQARVEDVAIWKEWSVSKDSSIKEALLRLAAYEDLGPVEELAALKERTHADVAPVVHGEWVLVGTNEHDYETSVEEKCSLCGRYVYRYDTEPQDNYCPNCGAKMNRESEAGR